MVLILMGPLSHTAILAYLTSLRGPDAEAADNYRRLRRSARGSIFHMARPANLAGANVRFGSLADMCSTKRHVRFTPNSGH